MVSPVIPLSLPPLSKQGVNNITKLEKLNVDPDYSFRFKTRLTREHNLKERGKGGGGGEG